MDDRTTLVQRLTASEFDVAYLTAFIRDQAAALQSKVECIERAVKDSRCKTGIDELIAEAYARYDADPRANGPDDFAAFKDALFGGENG